MAGSNSKESIKKDLAEMKAFLGQRYRQYALARVEKELRLLKNTRLDIAFTGVSGAGKSSLVNAFRNISDYEEGAAKTGVNQTTMDPERYPYPQFPELTLWDLPGIGTREFKPKEYLEKVNFNRYDFFIIVASERFTINDSMLASEIQKTNKRFYFVRTKVDQAIDAERRKPKFSEKQTLEVIRKYCLGNLKKEGAVNPRVFLVSSWHLNMYDFPDLQKTLADELNDLKRPLLIMAMPAFSREHLRKKKAAMESLIWKKALLSCGIGAIPIPGLSLIFDITLLMETMIQFCKAFCLDEDSLHNLAQRVGKPVDILKSAIKKTPLANQINPELVQSLSSKSLLVVSAMALEEFSDFIPVIGSLVGGVNSFATTFYMLKHFLEDAVEDAESLLAKVTEYNSC
ncbi:interferon-inducible GTPase 5-like [Paroedura picta]|uniref:interferon-inducible GTPase 5-like n=1 Tax=Paroedura picta TaxID=143630 RepID=UPI004057BEB4